MGSWLGRRRPGLPTMSSPSVLACIAAGALTGALIIAVVVGVSAVSETCTADHSTGMAWGSAGFTPNVLPSRESDPWPFAATLAASRQRMPPVACRLPPNASRQTLRQQQVCHAWDVRAEQLAAEARIRLMQRLARPDIQASLGDLCPELNRRPRALLQRLEAELLVTEHSHAPQLHTIDQAADLSYLPVEAEQRVCLERKLRKQWSLEPTAEVGLFDLPVSRLGEWRHWRWRRWRVAAKASLGSLLYRLLLYRADVSTLLTWHRAPPGSATGA